MTRDDSLDWALSVAVVAGIIGIMAWASRSTRSTIPTPGSDTPVDMPPPGGLPATGQFDPVTTTPTGTTAGIRDLAIAISRAEGFPIAGSIPARAHNPGDLVLGDRGGVPPTLGSQGITVFRSDAEGWAALEHQLQLIADGASHVYTPDMTFRAFGALWTRTQADDWAFNVVTSLNATGSYVLTPDDTLNEVLYE